VKKRNENNNLISTICESLGNDSVELIDFDTIKTVLIDLQTAQGSHEETVRELAFIKEEYCSRIIGMLKAVMACRPDESDAEILTNLSGDISNIEARKLVKLYSHTAARFRSCFPASFKYITSPTGSYNQKNWSEHKI